MYLGDRLNFTSQCNYILGVPALKRSELETACEDFSNIIGSTSSCMLYKGTLSSGVEIAVASSLVTSAKDWSKECESQYRKKVLYSYVQSLINVLCFSLYLIPIIMLSDHKFVQSKPQEFYELAWLL